MPETLRFFIGNGWISLWYFAMYFLVLIYPIIGAKELYSYSRSGGGPGGLGVFGVLMLECFVLGLVTFINAIVYARGAEISGLQKLGLVAGATVLVPTVVFFAGVPLGDGKPRGFWMFYIGIVLAVLVNLYLLFVATGR